MGAHELRAGICVWLTLPPLADSSACLGCVGASTDKPFNYFSSLQKAVS